MNYHKGDHIRIEAGQKVTISRIDMVARHNPQIEAEWLASDSELLLSTYISRNYQDLIQNEQALRDGSKIRVITFVSDKSEKSA